VADAARQRHRNQPALGAEIDRILDELVEQLHDEFGRAAHEAGIGRISKLHANFRKAALIGAHGEISNSRKSKPTRSACLMLSSTRAAAPSALKIELRR
jgi:hypothetical protein